MAEMPKMRHFFVWKQSIF